MADYWSATVPRNLNSLSERVKKGPFSEGQYRWWIFNAENNGMAESGAIVRIGRRIYIDEDGFNRWIESQQRREAA
jgi:hypothetical protein